LSYVSGTPNPTSVVGNVVTWNLGSIFTLGLKTAHLTLQVPADVGLIGTDLAANALVSISQAEPDLSNNSFNTITTVTASFDPNDKQAFTESNNDGSYFIDEDEWIDYTIRFQNTGTDTAFFVVITDTLPNTVDPASFVTGAASHNYTMDLSGQGILRFTFPNILLPDSNVNELASHGFVTFRIKAMEPVLPGTMIENIANIYFDYNEPVITEPSVLVTDFSTRIRDLDTGSRMVLAPNPTSGLVWVQLDATVDRNGSLRVLAMDGRLLLDERMTGQRTLLDLTELGPGAYLLEWTGNEGARLVMPIIRD
ncbi:MAG: hypothetical protein KDB95_08810, partial [Flavobacteriales bacterium]|nr:hypothetical protein [Flavobacteriales bacterium]